MEEVIPYAIATVLMLVGGLYMIAIAPMRYNGGRSDAARYRDNWQRERVMNLILLTVLTVAAFPVLLIMEARKK